MSGIAALWRRDRSERPTSLRRGEELGPGRHGQLVIAAACRIDNRAELRAALRIGDTATGDSELIVHAYRRWSEACVEHLLGDFAFALWDGERRVLFCARDPVGCEPFLYAHAGALFACASGLRSLLRLPELPAAVDPEGVAAYLVPSLNDGQVTLVEGVGRLPPGHTLMVEATGAPRLRCYWSPDPDHAIHLRRDHDYAGALREALTAAVRCRMPGTGPVATALSGGLDSSSVTALARSLAGDSQTVHAVSVRSGAAEDPAAIAAVLDQGGLHAQSVECSGRLLPEPGEDVGFFDSHAMIGRDAFAGAAATGSRILLTGDGGDEALSWGHVNWVTPAQLARERQWEALARAAVRAASVSVAARRAATAAATADRVGLRLPATADLLAPDLAARLQAHERVRQHEQRVRHGSLRAGHAVRIAFSGRVGAVEANATLAAQHGITVRSPFWDRRVIELCLAMPARQKEGSGLRHGPPRPVLRRAMSDLLPVEVLQRRQKAGQRARLRSELLALRRDRPELVAPAGALGQLLDSAGVHAAWASLDRPEASGGGLIACWSLAVLSHQILVLEAVARRPGRL